MRAFVETGRGSEGVRHEAASRWTLGLDHELRPLTLPAGAARDELIILLAAPIQHTKLHLDLSAGARQAVRLDHVNQAAAIEQGSAAVVPATAAEHPQIRFLPAGRQQLHAGLLAWSRCSSTGCR